MRLVLSVMLPFALVACAHAPQVTQVPQPLRDGKVSYEALPVVADGSYKLEASQTSFGAQSIARDPPAYPAELVASNLPPVTIRVKVIVDGEGKVTDVRDLDAPADEHHAAFFAACRQATLHWSYTPMTIVDIHEESGGGISQIRHTAPFSLDYAFHFELKDGAPLVSSDR